MSLLILSYLGIKALIAAVYYDFETEVVDGSGMKQFDRFIAKPVDNRLKLKFKYVSAA